MRTEARATPVDSSSQLTPTDTATDLNLAKNTAFPIARACVFSALALAGVAWDLYSKWYVFDKLGCPGSMPVWKGSVLGLAVQFDLATTFNHGALWGIGQNQTWAFATLSFLAVGAIFYFVWTRQAVASWWLTTATGLLLAGTLGNLYDRLGLHGWRNANGRVYAVRDFLDFIFCDGAFHWATFNFADMFLVTGAIMLVIQSFWTPNGERSDPNAEIKSTQARNDVKG